MNPKMRLQKLFSTSLETALKNKKMQKFTKPQVIESPSSISMIDVGEAMKKQNDVDSILTRKIIASRARNSNFIFSPASINAVNAMVSARSGSISEELKAVFSKIATVVFADGSANGGPKIMAINGVWVEQSLPVNHSFKDLLVNFFKATFTQSDFRFKAEQVRRELNSWASDHTNGLIKDVLPPGSITSDTERVYGNALYFKGAWKKPFKKSDTIDKDFHLLNSKSVCVPFMRSFDDQYIMVYDGFKVLRLPYRQGDDDTNREFSMCFFLPDKKDGLDSLVEKITSTPGFLDRHIPRYKVKVGEFRIPKFKISFGFSASSRDLDEWGMVSSGRRDSLHHKACVEIDEEGAEAAAVTFRGVHISLVTSRKRDFVADHPFYFLIREDTTGTILFAGQIFDPSDTRS